MIPWWWLVVLVVCSFAIFYALIGLVAGMAAHRAYMQGWHEAELVYRDAHVFGQTVPLVTDAILEGLEMSDEWQEFLEGWGGE